MSGGGGGQQQQQQQQQQTPALIDYPRAPIARTFQPGPPGGIGAVADQLAAGYGTSGGDVMSMLADLYQPMTIMQLMEPISVTAEQWDEKKYSPISTGNAVLDELLMGGGTGGGGASGWMGRRKDDTRRMDLDTLRQQYGST